MANPGTPLTMTLTGANTSNTCVDTLVVTDPVDPTATPNPFQHLALTSPATITPPPGAETVQVRAWVNGALEVGVDGPLPAALPDGVDHADVTGLQFVFTSTDGANIDSGATANINVTLEQRPNVVDLTDPITVTNDANTAVSLDPTPRPRTRRTTRTRSCRRTPRVAAGKTFDPDTVNAGDPSTVILTGTNSSQPPLDSLIITEPQPRSTSTPTRTQQLSSRER